MERVVGKETMKAWEKRLISEIGIPSLLLMEQAAMGLADVLEDRLADRANPRILFLSGCGNNGADVLAVARFLSGRMKQAQLTLLIARPEDAGTEEYRLQRTIDQNLGIPEALFTEEVKEKIRNGYYDCYVDGLAGIGFGGALSGDSLDIVREVNRAPGIKIAADIPTGVLSDSGAVKGEAFRADETVSFGFRKLGNCLYPGRNYSGMVTVVPLSGGKEAFFGKLWMTGGKSAGREALVLEPQDLKRFLPVRRDWSNKGSYGKVLLVAGSKDMAGAAAFAARAALLAGCGLVRILTPEVNRVALHTLVPEAVLSVYEKEEEALQLLSEQSKWADALIIGPGLGLSDTAKALLKATLTGPKLPLLIDGDALTLLSRDPACMKLLRDRDMPALLTPHLGEMSRLAGKTVEALQDDLFGEAGLLSESLNAICLCKDAVSVLAAPDGRRVLNESGCNGMATAGAGDVLAGLAGALMALIPDIFQAAALAALLHGLAGRQAALLKGNRSMTAVDILEGIPEVLKTC